MRDPFKLRPWYVRMWDGPVMGYLMCRILYSNRTDKSIWWKIRTALQWAWKYR